MIAINKNIIKELTKMELINLETTYLGLAYSYELNESPCGSRSMSRSAEKIALQKYTFAEQKLVDSFHLLFNVKKSVYDRTHKYLLSSISKDEMTPENAFKIWRMLYLAIDEYKTSKRVVA